MKRKDDPKTPDLDVLYKSSIIRPTKDHLAGIGLVVVWWELLRNTLRASLSWMADMKPYDGFIITDRMDVNVLLPLVQTFVVTTWPADAAKFKKLKDKIDNAYATRNVVAHSTWIEGGIKGSIRPVAIKKGKSLQTHVGDISLDDFHIAAWEIYLLIEEFKAFMEVRGVPAKWQGTVPLRKQSKS